MGKIWQKKIWSGVVYCATNLTNGHRYIGVTCQLLCERKRSHLWQALRQNSQTHFHRAIRKYGKENFKFGIIAEYDLYEEALAAEIRLIEETRPEYNMAAGGAGNIGWNPSKEQRMKMSIASKGRPGFWKGKTLPRHVTDLARERSARPTMKEAWKIYSRLGPRAQERKIVCLDDGKIYANAKMAAAAYGINSSSICAVCRKRGWRRTVKSLVFRYFGEHYGGKEEADKVREDRLISRRRTATIARAALLGNRINQ